MVGKISLFIVSSLLFQASSMKVILFFGDSLTAGYGLSPEEAFPALVEKSLLEKGRQVKVVNAGLSGETSAGGLSRIDWILRQRIDVFVLELGANDGLRGVPIEETRKNLQTIVEKVRSKNPECKVVLVGMMVPPNMGKEYATSFKNLFGELATRNKLVLMPFLLEGVAGNEKLNQPDGIHPTNEGHRIISKNLVKVIEPLL